MDQETIVVNAAQTIPALTSLSQKIRSVCSNKLSVKVLDLSLADPLVPRTQHFNNSIDFKSALLEPSHAKLRIISFHSPATCLPLKASARDFEALSDIYHISPDFLNTLTAFGRIPDPANGYTTTPTGSTVLGSKSFDAWYRLQYPELNERSKEEPWSIRHTGVYHKYSETTDFTLIVLIHPCRDARFESMIFDETPGQRERLRELSDPLNIHEMLCKTYLPNWSPYIGDQSKTQADINDGVQTCDIESGSLESDFRLAQRLRALKDTSLTCRALCQDNITVLDELGRIFPAPLKDKTWVSVARAEAAARKESIILLRDRIQNDIESLEHTAAQRNSRINRRNQAVAADLNESLLDLTRNTVDDSATVKIITVLSLIFLPGSFIATIFGMDFFIFEDSQQDGGSVGDGGDSNNHPWTGLAMGKNFWVFAAFWLPITVVVLLIYGAVLFCMRQEKFRRRRAEAKKEEQMKEV